MQFFFVKGKQKHSRQAFQSRPALLHPQDSAEIGLCCRKLLDRDRCGQRARHVVSATCSGTGWAGAAGQARSGVTGCESSN